MSAANTNPMERSMVSLLVVATTGGGRRSCVHDDEECICIYLFIYSSYSLATVRLWRRLHILVTKLVLWLLPQVPIGIHPRAVVQFGGVVPHCYPCVCSISRLLCPEPCLLGGHLAGLSSISSSLPLPFLVLFPAFVSSTVRNSI
jgi:hypothetical protein